MLGINPYRVALKIVDQEVDAAANIAGAENVGRAAEFDNKCPVPKKQQ